MLINFYKTSTFTLSVALVVSSVSALSLEESTSSTTTFVQTANELTDSYLDENLHDLSQTYADIDGDPPKAAPDAPPPPEAAAPPAKEEGAEEEKDPIANAATLSKFASDVNELKKATAAATDIVKASKEAMEGKKKEEDTKGKEK